MPPSADDPDYIVLLIQRPPTSDDVSAAAPSPSGANPSSRYPHAFGLGRTSTGVANPTIKLGTATTPVGGGGSKSTTIGGPLDPVHRHSAKSFSVNQMREGVMLGRVLSSNVAGRREIWPDGKSRDGLYVSKVLSRQHALLKVVNGKLTLLEMGTKNGTYYWPAGADTRRPGTKVMAGRKQDLHDGDVIALGETTKFDVVTRKDHVPVRVRICMSPQAKADLDGAPSIATAAAPKNKTTDKPAPAVKPADSPFNCAYIVPGKTFDAPPTTAISSGSKMVLNAFAKANEGQRAELLRLVKGTADAPVSPPDALVDRFGAIVQQKKADIAAKRAEDKAERIAAHNESNDAVEMSSPAASLSQPSTGALPSSQPSRRSKYGLSPSDSEDIDIAQPSEKNNVRRQSYVSPYTTSPGPRDASHSDAEDGNDDSDHAENSDDEVQYVGTTKHGMDVDPRDELAHDSDDAVDHAEDDDEDEPAASSLPFRYRESVERMGPDSDGKSKYSKSPSAQPSVDHDDLEDDAAMESDHDRQSVRDSENGVAPYGRSHMASLGKVGPLQYIPVSPCQSPSVLDTAPGPRSDIDSPLGSPADDDPIRPCSIEYQPSSPRIRTPFLSHSDDEDSHQAHPHNGYFSPGSPPPRPLAPVEVNTRSQGEREYSASEAGSAQAVRPDRSSGSPQGSPVQGNAWLRETPLPSPLPPGSSSFSHRNDLLRLSPPYALRTLSPAAGAAAANQTDNPEQQETMDGEDGKGDGDSDGADNVGKQPSPIEDGPWSPWAPASAYKPSSPPLSAVDSTSDLGPISPIPVDGGPENVAETSESAKPTTAAEGAKSAGPLTPRAQEVDSDDSERLDTPHIATNNLPTVSVQTSPDDREALGKAKSAFDPLDKRYAWMSDSERKLMATFLRSDDLTSQGLSANASQLHDSSSKKMHRPALQAAMQRSASERVVSKALKTTTERSDAGLDPATLSKFTAKNTNHTVDRGVQAARPVKQGSKTKQGVKRKLADMEADDTPPAVPAQAEKRPRGAAWGLGMFGIGALAGMTATIAGLMWAA